MNVLVNGTKFVPVSEISSLERKVQRNLIVNKLANIGNTLLKIDSETLSLDEEMLTLLNKLNTLKSKKIQLLEIKEKKEKEYNKFDILLHSIVKLDGDEKEQKFFQVWKQLEQCQTC